MPRDVFHCPARGKRFMFTGLIEGVGHLAWREPRGGDARLRIAVGTLPFDDVVPGESISVRGACLTVVAFDYASFDVAASSDTLALTTLGGLPFDAAVTLARAMPNAHRLRVDLARRQRSSQLRGGYVC